VFLIFYKFFGSMRVCEKNGPFCGTIGDRPFSVSFDRPGTSTGIGRVHSDIDVVNGLCLLDIRFERVVSRQYFIEFDELVAEDVCPQAPWKAGTGWMPEDVICGGLEVKEVVHLELKRLVEDFLNGFVLLRQA
jgi:hypothetical protein